MPQIVKGGKYVFGWSRVGETGRIIIPEEAAQGYGLEDRGVLLPGSSRSRGFAVTTQSLAGNSPIKHMVDTVLNMSVPEGEVLEIDGKSCCWVTIQNGRFTLPVATLERYSINPGDCLLSVRGSGIALGFIVQGPIVEEARSHPEIQMYE
jgi:bifunctional DNA-binding transcriptional regulator/antitoxin component of YhaV-PrlF toxin-antitoxin module